MTLDEWVEYYASDLKRDIETHVSVWDCEDQPGLVRMVMISVRNWAELSRGKEARTIIEGILNKDDRV